MTILSLLQKVSGRLRLARWWRISTIGLAAVFGLALATVISSRLLGWPVLPQPQFWWLALPMAVFPLAWLGAGQVKTGEAARLVDGHTDTRDLFLTAGELEERHRESDAFAPLVLEQAREKLPMIKPSAVVKVDWFLPLVIPASLALLIVAGWSWLPQLDPFGKQTIAKQEEAQRKLLDDMSRQTDERAQTLAAKKTDAPKPLEKEVDQLLQSFKEAKPATKEADLRKFSGHQKNLGDLWKQMQDRKLAEGLKDAAEQGFGAMGDETARKIREAVRNKDLDTVKKELEKLADQAKDLAGQEDGQEKREGTRELAKKARELADALGQELGGQSLQEAMKRAADQAAAGQGTELSKEALEAAAESLSLAEQELENLEQLMADEQLMQDALEALQQAKKIAQEGKNPGESEGEGDGPGDGEGKSLQERLEAYKEYFQEMMGQLAEGEGPGPGMKGPGTGEGGKSEEDESSKTGFKEERASSPLVAGKTLLDWKQRGIGQPGDKVSDYDESIQNLKQGVSEAIIKERVPAGYHEGINKYFDTIEEVEPPAPGTTKPGPAPGKP